MIQNHCRQAQDLERKFNWIISNNHLYLFRHWWWIYFLNSSDMVMRKIVCLIPSSTCTCSINDMLMPINNPSLTAYTDLSAGLLQCISSAVKCITYYCSTSTVHAASMLLCLHSHGGVEQCRCSTCYTALCSVDEVLMQCMSGAAYFMWSEICFKGSEMHFKRRK